MVMSTTALIPVEQYLRYSDKPNCEYRDGVLSPKPCPRPFMVCWNSCWLPCSAVLAFMQLRK